MKKTFNTSINTYNMAFNTLSNTSGTEWITKSVNLILQDPRFEGFFSGKKSPPFSIIEAGYDVSGSTNNIHGSCGGGRSGGGGGRFGRIERDASSDDESRTGSDAGDDSESEDPCSAAFQVTPNLGIPGKAKKDGGKAKKEEGKPKKEKKFHPNGVPFGPYASPTGTDPIIAAEYKCFVWYLVFFSKVFNMVGMKISFYTFSNSWRHISTHTIEDAESFKKWIFSLPANVTYDFGGTDLAAFTNHAFDGERLETDDKGKVKKVNVVIMSDGQPNDKALANRSIDRLTKQQRENYVLSFIGAGSIRLEAENFGGRGFITRGDRKEGEEEFVTVGDDYLENFMAKFCDMGAILGLTKLMVPSIKEGDGKKEEKGNTLDFMDAIFGTAPSALPSAAPCTTVLPLPSSASAAPSALPVSIAVPPVVLPGSTPPAQEPLFVKKTPSLPLSKTNKDLRLEIPCTMKVPPPGVKVADIPEGTMEFLLDDEDGMILLRNIRKVEKGEMEPCKEDLHPTSGGQATLLTPAATLTATNLATHSATPLFPKAATASAATAPDANWAADKKADDESDDDVESESSRFEGVRMNRKQMNTAVTSHSECDIKFILDLLMKFKFGVYIPAYTDYSKAIETTLAFFAFDDEDGEEEIEEKMEVKVKNKYVVDMGKGKTIPLADEVCEALTEGNPCAFYVPPAKSWYVYTQVFQTAVTVRNGNPEEGKLYKIDENLDIVKGLTFKQAYTTTRMFTFGCEGCIRLETTPITQYGDDGSTWSTWRTRSIRQVE